MATPLRLMTMNVGSGSGEPYIDFTVQAHARFINQVDPDVVFLQEVDRRTRRAGGVDQLQVLSDSTALKSNYFAKARDLEGGEYGDGIISRYLLENGQNRTVYTPSPAPWWDWLFKREAVSVAYAEVNVAGTRLRLYNTHFALQPERRKVGADALAAAIPPNVPTVLGGDFNGGPGEAEFTAVDRKFVSAGEIAGRVDIDLKYGEPMIDHILVSGGIACATYTRASAEEQPRGRFSDHGMLYAVLLVPPPPPPRPMTTVPYVREMRYAMAINEILAAGLESKHTGPTGPNAWVWDQSPEGGEIVVQGSTVWLQLRDEPIP